MNLLAQAWLRHKPKLQRLRQVPNFLTFLRKLGSIIDIGLKKAIQYLFFQQIISMKRSVFQAQNLVKTIMTH
jgi:hypothetical protein